MFVYCVGLGNVHIWTSIGTRNSVLVPNGSFFQYFTLCMITKTSYLISGFNWCEVNVVQTETKTIFYDCCFRTYWPSSCSEGKGLWFWSDFLWPVPAGWGGAITRTPAHGDTTGPAHPLRLCVVTLQPKRAQPPPHQRLHHQTGTNTTLFSLNSTVGAVRFWLLLIWTSEVDSFASRESSFFFLLGFT